MPCSQMSYSITPLFERNLSTLFYSTRDVPTKPQSNFANWPSLTQRQLLAYCLPASSALGASYPNTLSWQYSSSAWSLQNASAPSCSWRSLYESLHGAQQSRRAPSIHCVHHKHFELHRAFLKGSLAGQLFKQGLILYAVPTVFIPTRAYGDLPPIPHLHSFKVAE